jgi:predicted RNA methylase
MATQLTLALFENIEPVQQEIIGVIDAVKPASESSKTSGIALSKEPFLELPGLFPADFKSQIVADSTLEIDNFDPRQIPFDIQGDPNEDLWRAVKEGKLDREKVFYEYKSLGQTVTIEGNRGIPDLAKKRALNFQQHFTPTIIARFLAQALRLDIPGTPASVVDNSCGIGRMFQFLNPSCDLIGIEVEEKAYHMARTLFPNANIIHDDLINHPRIIADYFVINPPFSIQLEKKNCGFANAGWGVLGPGTSIKSHIAAMETAINSARYFVAAMLPTGYFTNEETLTFERWVNQRAKLVYRLDIDGKAFTKYGFTWPCSVVIYCTDRLEISGTIQHKTQ